MSDDIFKQGLITGEQSLNRVRLKQIRAIDHQSRNRFVLLSEMKLEVKLDVLDIFKQGLITGEQSLNRVRLKQIRAIDHQSRNRFVLLSEMKLEVKLDLLARYRKRILLEAR